MHRTDESDDCELRTAAHAITKARGLDRRPVKDCLPYLAEDVGRLLRAVRCDDVAAVRTELAACVSLLDRFAEVYDGRDLAVVAAGQVSSAGRKLPVASW